MMGFKITIDIHGKVIEVTQPKFMAMKAMNKTINVGV
jgi:hypothetical protein